MKRCLALLLIVALAACGFTLGPSRYTITIPPGGRTDIQYAIKGDGEYIISSELGWLNLPRTVEAGNHTVRLSVPGTTEPGHYQAFVSVMQTSGMVRAELRSRLLIHVVGEPVIGRNLTLLYVLVGIAALVMFSAIVVIRRRRY